MKQTDSPEADDSIPVDLVEEELNWEMRKQLVNQLVGTSDKLYLNQHVNSARQQVLQMRSAGLVPQPPKSWQSIGPDNVPGRINALAINPQNGQILYAGAAAGGVFKTIDGGVSWKAKWSQEESLAIGGLAVAPSNPDIIYASTGEWVEQVGAENNHFSGVGVYRSDDAGETWKKLSPFKSLNTAAVAIHPTNPNLIFVAGDTSLHRSQDGGQTWDITGKNLYGIFDDVISDVVINHANPNYIYIAIHLNGIWRSRDGGNTFSKLTNGIAIGRAASAPKIALGQRGKSESKFVAVKMGRRVFTSTNSGDAFVERQRCGQDWPFYPWANVIAVDPTNENVLLAGHDNLYRSTNGGRQWSQVGGYYKPPVHADQQAIVYDPHDHRRIYLATDGGVYLSTNSGKIWEARSDGLITTQCWTVGVSQSDPLILGITTQDNACYIRKNGNSYTKVLNPEGGWIEFDHHNHKIIYADTWFSRLKKSTTLGRQWSSLNIDTADLSNSEALSIAWGDSSRLLVVTKFGEIMRSLDGGHTWMQSLSNPNVIYSTVAYSPSNDDYAFTASTRGRVWRTVDGGKSWTELRQSILPSARIHSLVVDWKNSNRFYLAFGTLGVPQLWKVEIDQSGSIKCKDITGNIQDNMLPDLAITGLVLDPSKDNTIYVSNIMGVFRSRNNGLSWEPFDDGLPNSFISDLDIRISDSTLYASTMGRGLYRCQL